MRSYDKAFYEDQMTGSARSARAVVPLVLALVPAHSVCDVGCGVGTWLSAFMKEGVDDALGLDGDYVPAEYLHVPRSAFRSSDLRRPIELERVFDLTVSLEVAEHLPDAYAETFVKSLTRLAPVILFSAAVPHQGGHDHVNEQWPDYWERLFRKENYHAVDALRPRIWENTDIEWWYCQNMFIYVREGELAKYPALAAAAAEPQMPRRVVHPIMFERMLRRPSRLAGMATAAVRSMRVGLAHPSPPVLISGR
jgi:hypothetical protein